MQRRKFFIPKGEIFRDYRDGHEKDAVNYLFACDYIEVEDEDSFN